MKGEKSRGVVRSHECSDGVKRISSSTGRNVVALCAVCLRKRKLPLVSKSGHGYLCHLMYCTLLVSYGSVLVQHGPCLFAYAPACMTGTFASWERHYSILSHVGFEIEFPLQKITVFVYQVSKKLIVSSAMVGLMKKMIMRVPAS